MIIANFQISTAICALSRGPYRHMGIKFWFFCFSFLFFFFFCPLKTCIKRPYIYTCSNWRFHLPQVYSTCTDGRYVHIYNKIYYLLYHLWYSVIHSIIFFTSQKMYIFCFSMTGMCRFIEIWVLFGYEVKNYIIEVFIYYLECCEFFYI